MSDDMTHSSTSLDLQDAASRALARAVVRLRASDLNPRFRQHGWSLEKIEELADYFTGLTSAVESGERLSRKATTNMSKWFDYFGVTGEDELTEAAYEASDHYNAYVRWVSGPRTTNYP